MNAHQPNKMTHNKIMVMAMTLLILAFTIFKADSCICGNTTGNGHDDNIVYYYDPNGGFLGYYPSPGNDGINSTGYTFVAFDIFDSYNFSAGYGISDCSGGYCYTGNPNPNGTVGGVISEFPDYANGDNDLNNCSAYCYIIAASAAAAGNNHTFPVHACIDCCRCCCGGGTDTPTPSSYIPTGNCSLPSTVAPPPTGPPTTAPPSAPTTTPTPLPPLGNPPQGSRPTKSSTTVAGD